MPSVLSNKHLTEKALRNIDMLLIPIIMNRHWVLLISFIKKHKFELYDPVILLILVQVLRKLYIIAGYFLIIG